MLSLLIIFDLDGTLVDSERLCNQAFIDLLPSLNESVDELIFLYRGKKLSEILNAASLRDYQTVSNRYTVSESRRFSQLI
jgi:beta-phosphoglucomutase-like phosphatase (HAD superfamily)